MKKRRREATHLRRQNIFGEPGPRTGYDAAMHATGDCVLWIRDLVCTKGEDAADAGKPVTLLRQGHKVDFVSSRPNPWECRYWYGWKSRKRERRS